MSFIYRLIIIIEFFKEINMKLTKTQLNRVIKEELQAIMKENSPDGKFGSEKQGASVAQKAGRETLKGAGKASPQERAVINNLLHSLTTAAANGNILSGTAGTIIQKLQNVLKSFIKTPAEEAPAEEAL